MNVALITPIIASNIVLALGLVGTLLILKKTQGLRERNLLKRAAVGVWIGLVVVALMANITAQKAGPKMFGMFLVFGLVFVRAKQKQIQREDSASV